MTEEYTETKSELAEREGMCNTLQWAKDFMDMFEKKEGMRAETNRSRQQKYF